MFSFDDPLDASEFNKSKEIFEANFFKVIDLIIYCYSLVIKYEEPKYYPKRFHLENELTITLVSYLIKNKHLFNIDHLGFEIEVGTLDSTNLKFIDIKVTNASHYFLDTYVEHIYYAIECKRLDKYASKIKYYISGGILRFVNSDYSKNLPLAGMIGYIEKGNSNVIVKKINKKLEKIADIKTTQNLTKMIDPEIDYCYCSKHIKNDNSSNNIDLYHLMLDYSDLIVHKIEK